MLQKIVKSCKIFLGNVTSLLLFQCTPKNNPLHPKTGQKGLIKKKSKKNLWGVTPLRPDGPAPPPGAPGDVCSPSEPAKPLQYYYIVSFYTHIDRTGPTFIIYFAIFTRLHDIIALYFGVFAFVLVFIVHKLCDHF